MIAAASIPALVAFALKAGLMAYARRGRRHDPLVRLYVVLLALFSLQDIVEFVGLNHLAAHHDDHIDLMGRAYFAVTIPAFAVLLHMALALKGAARSPYVRVPLYASVVALEVLLLGSHTLIAGFHAFRYTLLRTPGPDYALFETFAVLCMGGALVTVAAGARHAASAQTRLRLRWWLVGIAPFALLTIYLIIANHFSQTPITSTLYGPLAFCIFLLVTAYATHEYRLLDMEFYLPGSRTRRRKTAFYQRLTTMIAEIADLATVDEAVRRLSQTLGCGVALVTPQTGTVAMAGGAPGFRELPRIELARIEHICVANELGDSAPGLQRLMQTHGVAAIVPFHPYSRHAVGWLLLGNAFSEEVLTPRDFHLVEQLFDRLSDLFVDRLLSMRASLSEALRENRALKLRERDLAETLRVTSEQRDQASRRLTALIGPQWAPPALPDTRMLRRAEIRIALMGDTALLKALRRHVPGVQRYRPGIAPEILLMPASAGDLQNHLDGFSGKAILLYGANAHGPSPSAHRNYLMDVMPDTGGEPIAQRIDMLLSLVAAIEHQDAEEPLLGESPAYRALIAQARALARVDATIVINGPDPGQVRSLKAFIEQEAGAPRVIVVGAHADQDYRHAVRIAFPTLAERPGDSVLLAQYFAIRYRHEAGSARILNEAELVDIAGGAYPTVQALRGDVLNRLSRDPMTGSGQDLPGGQDLKACMEEFEARLITQTLTRCGGNRAQTARALGIKPNTLHYKLKRLGLSPDD